MIITPKIRGFICTTAHPEGCAKNVQEQIEYVKQHTQASQQPKKVLVIGASTGYGLASRIVAAFGSNAKTIGVFFERPAAGKRTASAGWYNSAAFEAAAHGAGIYAKSINGDAFSDELKQQTIELIQKDWGGEVDLVIYSLASPRRTDPKTGDVYNSTLKPVGEAYDNKTADVMTGDVSQIHIDPATDEDISNTVKVMGGEDWQLWMDALLDAGVLAKGAMTVAYSYIGPSLTYPIYRNGTIGKAKEDLEKTVTALNQKLMAVDGKAFISVNKAVVTQASAAIPVVPLYLCLLFRIMKEKKNHEGCIEQIQRLFTDRLYAGGEVPVDAEGRIRIDDWEMQDDVQEAVKDMWSDVTTENLESETDLQGYRDEFHRLFGFGLSGVNYDQDIDVEVSIPSLAEETASI
ncbi:MAG: enoyl-ACP reductase FabV [Gammaproteobacteria bacterium]